MSRSPYIDSVVLTPKHSGKRTEKVQAFVIHHMTAKWTGKRCAEYFRDTPSRQASANYCILVMMVTCFERRRRKQSVDKFKQLGRPTCDYLRISQLHNRWTMGGIGQDTTQSNIMLARTA